MKKKTTKARSYSTDFKEEAVRLMAQATSITGLAEELGIRRKFLYQWRHQFEAEGRAGLERRRGRPPGSKSQTVSPPRASAAELRIAELERLLGRKQLEVDFLRRAFEQVRGAASSRTSDGGKESIARSKSRSRSKE
jgi:transposase